MTYSYMKIKPFISSLFIFPTFFHSSAVTIYHNFHGINTWIMRGSSSFSTVNVWTCRSWGSIFSVIGVSADMLPVHKHKKMLISKENCFLKNNTHENQGIGKTCIQHLFLISTRSPQRTRLQNLPSEKEDIPQLFPEVMLSGLRSCNKLIYTSMFTIKLTTHLRWVCIWAVVLSDQNGKTHLTAFKSFGFCEITALRQPTPIFWSFLLMMT